jgi:hypothetical protein
MNRDRRRADGSTDGDEDCRQCEPTSSQAEPSYWSVLLERVELGVAEINRNAEMVERTLGGEGLRFRADGDSMEVTRLAPPPTRLLVTNHGTSVSAEWVTETGGGQEGDGNRRKRGPLYFDADPTSGPVLRKESGASMLLDEAVRYFFTPLLMPLK